MNRVQRWLYPELTLIAERRDLEFKIRELISRDSLAPKREAMKNETQQRCGENKSGP